MKSFLNFLLFQSSFCVLPCEVAGCVWFWEVISVQSTNFFAYYIFIILVLFRHQMYWHHLFCYFFGMSTAIYLITQINVRWCHSKKIKLSGMITSLYHCTKCDKYWCHIDVNKNIFDLLLTCSSDIILINYQMDHGAH